MARRDRASLFLPDAAHRNNQFEEITDIDGGPDRRGRRRAFQGIYLQADRFIAEGFGGDERLRISPTCELVDFFDGLAGGDVDVARKRFERRLNREDASLSASTDMLSAVVHDLGQTGSCDAGMLRNRLGTDPATLQVAKVRAHPFA